MNDRYLEWRDTVAERREYLPDALARLTTTELYAAQERLMGGFAAERLNPEKGSGDFHYAAGLIRELLRRRKLVDAADELGHVLAQQPKPMEVSDA